MKPSCILSIFLWENRHFLLCFIHVTHSVDLPYHRNDEHYWTFIPNTNCFCLSFPPRCLIFPSSYKCLLNTLTRRYLLNVIPLFISHLPLPLAFSATSPQRPVSPTLLISPPNPLWWMESCSTPPPPLAHTTLQHSKVFLLNQGLWEIVHV